MTNFRLKQIDETNNLFVIMENGQSVLHGDAVRFGLSKNEKNTLLAELKSFCNAFEIDPVSALRKFTDDEILKRLDRDIKAKAQGNLWEIRSPEHGGRIFFILSDDGSVIVSAVNKNVKSKSGKPQTEAINRGVNRWKALLHILKKKT